MSHFKLGETSGRMCAENVTYSYWNVKTSALALWLAKHIWQQLCPNSRTTLPGSWLHQSLVATAYMAPSCVQTLTSVSCVGPLSCTYWGKEHYQHQLIQENGCWSNIVCQKNATPQYSILVSYNELEIPNTISLWWFIVLPLWIKKK